MNAQQMQQTYRQQYPQGQRGQPTPRRPGESDSRTNAMPHPSSQETVDDVPTPTRQSARIRAKTAAQMAAHVEAQAHSPTKASFRGLDGITDSSPYQLRNRTSSKNKDVLVSDWTESPSPSPKRKQRQRQPVSTYQGHPHTPTGPRIPLKSTPSHPQYNGIRPSFPRTVPWSSNLQATGQMPPNSQQYAQQQAQIQAQRQQHQNAVLEHQNAQRRARKPTDRNLPDGIEDIIIGEGAQQYKDLQDLERRLDYTMQRKRLDLQETYARNTKRWKTLRIWVSNTANNQPWQGGALEDAFDFQSAGDSTVRVKVEGRLLGDVEEEGEEEEKSTDKMTKFFKSLNVEFAKDKNNVPDPGWQVEWKKQPNAPDLDCISFQRKCDENINININLTRDDSIDQRFRLSAILAQTLDMEEGDRAEVVMGLWEYIKLFNLQEDEDKRLVRCDEQLRQIFNADQIYFPQIPDRIMSHLHPLPPVKLQYTVRVDQEFLENPTPTVYDVRVIVEDPLKARIKAITANPELAGRLRQISQLDDQIAVVVQALHNSKARHTFFKSMAKDPGNTINRWMSSQRRDLEIILGEAGRGGGEDGTGPEFARGGKDGVWGSTSVEEAVRYMLAKPQQKV